VIVGDADRDGPVTVRDLESGDQREISVSQVAEALRGTS
jgi:histidyl-tRNA synthetase